MCDYIRFDVIYCSIGYIFFSLARYLHIVKKTKNYELSSD